MQGLINLGFNDPLLKLGTKTGNAEAYLSRPMFRQADSEAILRIIRTRGARKHRPPQNAPGVPALQLSRIRLRTMFEILAPM